jgi:hypothetical protein
MVESDDFMNTQGKAAVVLLSTVAGLAIVVAASAITLQIRERDLRLAKERELLLVQAEKDDLEQQLAEVRDAKRQVENQLAQVKDQLDQTTKQLAEEFQAKEQLIKAANERQQQIDELVRDLEQTRMERQGLMDQLSRLRTDQESLQKQLTQAQQAKAQLEQQVLELSEQPTVELDKVVVTKPTPTLASAPVPESVDRPHPGFEPEVFSSPASAPQEPALQGQVIVVNREYDFIVVNLGSSHGLVLGQEFQIVRGEQVLGRVKVEKIYDELSAATILPESNEEAIREGDLLKAI